MTSLKTRLDACQGVGPGFDLLRISLAFAIFYGHTLWVAGGNHHSQQMLNFATSTGLRGANRNGFDGGGWTGLKRPLHVALVPMFFALSGFLVMGSAYRLRDVRTFLAFRALRLFPALVVEVTLSAVLLGAAFTSHPIGRYLREPDFYRYFGNMVGWVTFHLPGVFASNPVPGIVNVNLWTLPSEFDCYAIAAILMASGLLYRRVALIIIFSGLSFVFVALNSFSQFAVTPTVLAPHTITYYFFFGVVFYTWREFIPFNLVLFLVSCVSSYILLFYHHTVYLACPFVTYCTVYLGLTKFPNIRLLKTGDYSYGLYLYGFPISQAVVAFYPKIVGHGWLNVIISFLLSLDFAAFSWHAIEKRALRLKRHLPSRYFPTRAGTHKRDSRGDADVSLRSR